MALRSPEGRASLIPRPGRRLKNGGAEGEGRSEKAEVRRQKQTTNDEERRTRNEQRTTMRTRTSRSRSRSTRTTTRTRTSRSGNGSGQPPARRAYFAEAALAAKAESGAMEARKGGGQLPVTTTNPKALSAAEGEQRATTTGSRSRSTRTSTSRSRSTKTGRPGAASTCGRRAGRPAEVPPPSGRRRRNARSHPCGNRAWSRRGRPSHVLRAGTPCAGRSRCGPREGPHRARGRVA